MLKTFIWLFGLYLYICSIKTKQHGRNNIRHNHTNYIYFNCSYLFNQLNLITWKR